MTNQHNSIKHGFAFLILALFIAMVGFIVLAPGQNAHALDVKPQADVNDCAECHSQNVEHWQVSKHGAVPINCETCHIILPGEGEQHPELRYSTEREELTCGTCHNDYYTQWYGGQHNELNMNCATCHEPHSQQQILLGDRATTCENCHQKQVNAGHESTHLAAGATCTTCHIKNESGHAFQATLSTCTECHSDIHEANRFVVAGLDIAGIPETESAPVEVNEAEPVESEAPRGGVNLPSWLMLLVGLLVGGGVIWVVIGKDPGTPTEEEEK
jgi:hypothetical protein